MKLDKNLTKLLTLWVKPMPKSANHVLQAEEQASAVFKPQHSLTKPYRDSLDWWIPKWKGAGHATVTSQYVGLTKMHPHEYGALWNTEPISMDNWLTEINFRIYGKKHDFGDGIQFWFAREPPIEPRDKFTGLAISIDTHNDEHRHGDAVISAMVHSGRHEDGPPRIVGSCDARVRNLHPLDNPWMQISYYRNLLTVSMNHEGTDEWIHCFAVPGLLLPNSFYLGCSATTSDLTDNHHVMEMKMYELENDHSEY